MSTKHSLSLQRRWLLWALLGCSLVGLFVYAPLAFSTYHNWRLARTPLPQLEALVRRTPGDAEARYRLGLAYGRANRPQEAVRELVTVLERDPTRAEVLNDLGALYLLQGRYYESLVALNGAVEAQPKYATAYANLGRLHLATKMPFTAVRELEKASTLAPGNPDILCDLGEAYQRTLNFNSAVEAYRRALRSKPNSRAASLGLGKAYYSLTRYDEAEKELNHTLAMAPEDGGALAALGRLKLDRAAGAEDLRGARDLLKRAGRADPQDSEVWYDLGRVALRQEKPADAILFLRKAIELAPSNTAALFQLSRALQASGNSAEAARVSKAFNVLALRSREQDRLEEQVYRSPNDWDATARLAELYLLNNEPGLAGMLCRQLSEGAPNHPRLPGLLQKLARRAQEVPANGAAAPAGATTAGAGGG